ncbi:MAG: hypothetical protein ACE5KT_10450 [Methanosarcinales archaeon]
MATLTIKLDDNITEILNKFAKDEHIPVDFLIKKFIEERLEQYKIEKAIALYANDKGSLKIVSEKTGVPLRILMKELREREIPLKMNKKVFENGMQHAKNLFGF